VSEGKPTEPQALKEGLEELLERYPLLRLFTGDALFTRHEATAFGRGPKELRAIRRAADR
jgi:hypothetical protein